MTGPGHYRLAEELLAAAAMAGDFGNRVEADAWRQAAGTTLASRLA